jgi:hypothetical protein
MTEAELVEMIERSARREAIDDWIGFALKIVPILMIGAMAFWTIAAPDGLAYLAARLIAG